MRVISCCGILMLVYFAWSEVVPWVGGGNRPVAVGEEQPVPGAGASSLRREWGCAGAGAGQGCAEKGVRGMKA